MTDNLSTCFSNVTACSSLDCSLSLCRYPRTFSICASIALSTDVPHSFCFDYCFQHPPAGPPPARAPALSAATEMFDTKSTRHVRHFESRELANGYVLSLIFLYFRPSLREDILKVLTRSRARASIARTHARLRARLPYSMCFNIAIISEAVLLVYTFNLIMTFGLLYLMFLLLWLV